MRRSRFFRARADGTQKSIVDALRAAGWQVFIIGYPCDLLCFKAGVWRTLECKPEKRKRKDQPKQDEFLMQTGTPRVRTPEDALKAIA